MYIEDYLKHQQKPESDPSDVEFSTRRLASGKHAVYQRRVGCVFVGQESDCAAYIRQARAKKALKETEKTMNPRRGMNPFFTR